MPRTTKPEVSEAADAADALANLAGKGFTLTTVEAPEGGPEAPEADVVELGNGFVRLDYTSLDSRANLTFDKPTAEAPVVTE